MSMDYVRKTYGVPAKRGGRIRFTGDCEPIEGTILSATHRLRVRFDGSKARVWLHPTWCVEYLDSTPAGAAP